MNTRLDELERRFQAIEQPPATSLEILGESGLERHWESLLAYFVNPAKPHGFGTTVLEAFVESVASLSETSISKDLPGLEEVKVRTQVPTTSGPVDLLLWVVDEWFICVEIKVHAGETGNQTIRYAEAPRIGSLIKSNHGGIGEYIYLAPENSRLSSKSPFVELDWGDFIPHLEPLVSDNAQSTPELSRVQLSDYIRTIKRELNMGEFTELSEETRLYAEYADTINAVAKKHHEEVEQLYDRLKNAFLFEFKSSDDVWDHRLSGNTKRTKGWRYMQLYKTWWHSLDGGTKIEYEPQIKADRIPPEIRLRLDIEGGNYPAVRKEVLERIGRETLTSMGWEFRDKNTEFVGKSIPLDFDNPNEAINESIEELRELHNVIGETVDQVAKDLG